MIKSSNFNTLQEENKCMRSIHFIRFSARQREWYDSGENYLNIYLIKVNHQKIPAWCSKWDFLYRIEFVSPFSLKKSCHCLWEGHEIACGNILWSHWVMQNFNKWRLSKNLCMEVCHNDKHCNHDDSNLLLTVFISIFKCIYWKCPLTVHHSF